MIWSEELFISIINRINRVSIITGKYFKRQLLFWLGNNDTVQTFYFQHNIHKIIFYTIDSTYEDTIYSIGEAILHKRITYR